MYNNCTYMVGSLTKARLFGSIEEDADCEYDHNILIDDSSAKVATRTIVLLEKTIQTRAKMF